MNYKGFSGMARKVRFSDMTSSQLRNALIDAGLYVTDHFVERLRDSRIMSFGVETLDDLDNWFKYGKVESAKDGYKALVYGQVAVIFDPNDSDKLVTITPDPW